jgi:hypothetical protein
VNPRRYILAPVLMTACGLIAGAAMGTVEGPVQVAQPIWSEAGTFVCTVTYIVNQGPRIPGFEVTLVAAEDCLPLTRGGAENRNAAHELGIQAGIDSLHYTGRLYGDTLKVYLDFSHLKPAPAHGDGPGAPWSRAHQIKATVESVLRSAWYGRMGCDENCEKRVEARCVQLAIRGTTEYGSYARVYRLADERARLEDYDGN